MQIDPKRERKSAVLQIVGGVLILIAGVDLLVSNLVVQSVIAGLVGAYFVAVGIFKWVTTNEDFPNK